MKQILILILALFAIQGRAETIVIPRLSPTPANIQKVPLSGKWMFSENFNTKTSLKPIDVPGEWVMQGFNVEKGTAAGYFREFSLPSEWKGERIKLRCNGVYSKAVVYINGKEVGGHLGGFTPFEIDVTNQVKLGATNAIAVAVTSETVADSTSNASRYAVHPLGGITRDIYLFALPEVNISSFHATTTFDSLYNNATLGVEVELAAECATVPKNVSVKLTLTDPKGNIVPLTNNTVSFSSLQSDKTETQNVSFKVDSPQKWDPEHPNLYTLTAELFEGSNIVEKSIRRIGFRQIEVRGNEIFVNNHSIKLRGACRHEVHPLTGRTLQDSLWRKDVILFRNANVNYIRTSHYPPDEALFEACDELGMFVEVEAPFCWAHETKVSEKDHYAVLVNQHIEMVHLNRTHPSVLIWSLGNESNLYNEYFKRSGEIVQKMDPTRPRIFSQWGPDADNNELEIGNHHYPGPTGPDMYRNAKRPIVFDEYSHLNAYNRLELSADPALRDKWGELLSYMWDDMYYSKGVLGGAIWAAIDDTFFLPGEKAVGYGTWGPIDGWRRPKPEYWGMKKSYSPVKLTLKGNMTSDGSVTFEVENRHLFANLSECEIRWSSGTSINGKVNPNIAPRKNGEFTIKVPTQTESIDIEVIGARGFSVDTYQFRIKPETIVSKPLETYKMKWVETENEYQITIDNTLYAVSKVNGLLSVTKEEVIVAQAPQLMLLPLNEEGRGIQMLGEGQNFDPYNPTCKNWVATNVTAEKVAKGFKITVEGFYKEAKGKFTYLFRDDKQVTIDYDFTVKETISPRQTGIVFTLAETMTTLKWKRDGFWNAYPENHIAALEGEAELFDKTLPINSLAGPSKQPSVEWAFDQTASGSNIFRSTKEQIREVTLSNLNGAKICIFSDGTQHSRAWKDNDAIKLLIADYNNGGNDRFLVSHAEKQYKKLNPGDKVCGSVQILF